MISCAAKGSSHLKAYNSRGPNLGFTSVHSYSGLTVMPAFFKRDTLDREVKPKHKVRQMDSFIEDIRSEDSKVLALCVLSNDYKAFLTIPTSFLVTNIPREASHSDIVAVFRSYGCIQSLTVRPQSHGVNFAVIFFSYITRPEIAEALTGVSLNGQELTVREQSRELLEVSDDFCQVWREWPLDLKRRFSVLKEEGGRRRLHKHYIKHLLHQFNLYKEVLIHMFKDSSIETVLHMSALERLNDHFPSMDLLFGLLNSMLRESLRFWNRRGSVKNKFGHKVTFVFVDLQHIFWEAPNKIDIFSRHEWQHKAEKTHRNKHIIYRMLRLVFQEATSLG